MKRHAHEAIGAFREQVFARRGSGPKRPEAVRPCRLAALAQEPLIKIIHVMRALFIRLKQQGSFLELRAWIIQKFRQRVANFMQAMICKCGMWRMHDLGH